MKVLKRKEVYIPLMILGVFAFLFLCQSKVNIKKNMYIEEYNNALNDYENILIELNNVNSNITEYNDLLKLYDEINTKFEEYESIYNEDLTKKIDELRNDIK